MPQIVPYPLPLSSPPVLVDFNERRLRVIASNCRVETRVSIYLCRDRSRDFKVCFETTFFGGDRKPQEMVADGEKRLAAKLRQLGTKWSLQKGNKSCLTCFTLQSVACFLFVCWAFTKACDKL